MSDWVLRGLRSGAKSTGYPAATESALGVSPGLPRHTELAEAAGARALAERCPTGALAADGTRVLVDRARCINCYRCARGVAIAADWDAGYEWAGISEAALLDAGRRLSSAFGGSLHVRVVDGGDCSACLSEIAQLSGPYYSFHRLGFFITPTPRHADAMIVVGPVTDQMRPALRNAYEAMPAPKRVIAAGACALSGGIFGPSWISGGGAAEAIPVDVTVPGCPPPPLAFIHALLVAVGRKPAAETPQR